MKRLLILGIDRLDRHAGARRGRRATGDFEIVGLSAGTAYEPLIEQARAHGVRRIALSDRDAAARAAESWTGGDVLARPARASWSSWRARTPTWC